MPPIHRIELPPWAYVLFERSARYKVLYGGRGSGKSWAVARVLLIMATQRKLRILCAREFQKSIDESVHRLLQEQITLLGLPGWVVRDYSIFNLVTGSQFIFAGLRQNVSSIQSLEAIDICWVEEAQTVSERSWRKLTPTIRKSGSEVWMTFNPELETDPTYKRFVLNPPKGSIVCKVLWRDNPWFPDVLRDEMEHCKSVDPEEYQHVWEGECWKKSNAQIFSGRWVVDYFEPQQDWNGPYYGADWGFSTSPLTVGKQWIYDDELYIEYCEAAFRLGLDKHAEFFERVPGIREATIRSDPARPETINYMCAAGFDVIPADKWPGSVEDGITFLQGFKRIVIHPRAKKAIQDFQRYSYKVDALNGDIRREIVKKYDDAVDQCRYSIDSLIKNKPITMLECV